MLFLSSLGYSSAFEGIIAFLNFVFSSIENTLLFLAWILIIIPTLLCTLLSYNPKDPLGYVSASLLWCVCGFLVILSPVSLLLYFLYRWLYKKVSALWPKWKSRIRPWFKKAKDVLSNILSVLLDPFLMLGMMVFVAVYAIFVAPFLSLIKWVKKKIQERKAKQSSPPVNSIHPESPTSCEDDTQQLASRFIKADSIGMQVQSKEQSPAHELCSIIWRQTDLYIKYVDQGVNRKQHMYLWASYFYVVVKSVKDQRFINEIYSYFEEFAIRYVRDPANRSFVVHEMKMDYREIRSSLNTSGINPCNETGRSQLWDFIAARIYESKDYPTNAHSRFIAGAVMLIMHSRRLYHNVPSSDSQPKYSIAESADTESLPDE